MYCKRCDRETNFIHRDYTYRYKKMAGGEKERIRIERMKCTECGTLKRILPDDILPFKQYSKEIIEKCTDEEITSDDLEYEDYPCEMTMKRWIDSQNRHSSI